MAFYLRKSVRVGPVRFNLSKSGIGVSAGVRGLRFGISPRGNYVRVGRNGIYYRSIDSSNRKLQDRSVDREPFSVSPADPVDPEGPPAAGGSLREIESAEVSQMRDSSSAGLLDELDRKRRAARIAPAIGWLGVILVVVLVVSEVPVAALVAAVITVAAYAAGRRYDEMSKSVVLLYELEAGPEKDYQLLHNAFDVLRSSARSWHIEAEGDVADRKRNAGATNVVRKKSIALSKSAPPFVKTNIEIPSIPVGRQTLYFLPDRILVVDRDGVGTVGYRDLRIESRATRFIEDGSVPADAKVVDRTWRYVNKKGGPDRRFKDNREIPIMLYEELHLMSGSGLNELLQFSKLDVAGKFEQALCNLGRSGQDASAEIN